MHTHNLHAHHRAHRAARARAVRTGIAAGVGVASLALAAACNDTPAPVQPKRGAALASAAHIGVSATHSLLAKGFARLLTTEDGVVAGTQTYNASGLRVEAEYLHGSSNSPVTVRFNGLRGLLRGEPHVQVTPVRHYSQERGTDRCQGAGLSNANGADIDVHVSCSELGFTRMVLAAQVFDRDAPAAYATVDSTTGAATNAHHLSRSERVGEGRYRVFFKRDPLFGAGAKPIAFITPRSRAYMGKGQTAIIPCELTSVGSKAQRADELGVEVDCFHPSTREELRHFDGAFNVVALAQLPRTAYALVGDHQRLFADNSHNPGGQTTVARVGTGTYRIGFQGVAQSWTDYGTAMVTAHGANGGSCVLDTWTKVAGGARVDVQCRGRMGELADQRFAVLATTRH